jgi:hypothetical protein
MSASTPSAIAFIKLEEKMEHFGKEILRYINILAG